MNNQNKVYLNSIRDLLEIGVTTEQLLRVKVDEIAINEQVTLAKVPDLPHDKFAKLIQVYSNLISSQFEINSNLKNNLIEVVYSDIYELLNMDEDAFSSIQSGLIVKVPQSQQIGVENLFKEIFGIRRILPDLQDIVQQELDNLIMNRISVPSKPGQMSQLLWGLVMRRLINGSFSMVVNSIDIAEIDKALDSLTNQEQKVIRFRLGLTDNTNILTFREISEELKVGNSRIQQIFGKAIRKLRHPSRSRKLKSLLGNLNERYIDLSNRAISFIDQIEARELALLESHNSQSKIPILERSIDDFELSVRAYNVLKNADCRTMADVVKKTERYLSLQNNCGRKTLLEIKDLLSRFKLTLLSSDG